MPVRRQWILTLLAAGTIAAAAQSSAQTRSGNNYGASGPTSAESTKTADDATTSVADPGELAFEQHRWQDAINEYRKLLASSPEDRLSLLRIAQAQRELRKYNDALATLEQARTANAPEAMVDLERARNLALLGRKGRCARRARRVRPQRLAALELVETAHEFDAFPWLEPLRARASQYPCARVPVRGRGRGEGLRFLDRPLGGARARRHARRHRHDREARRRLLDLRALRRRRRLLGHEPRLLLAKPRRMAECGPVRGTLFDLTGKLVDGAMKMEGQVEYIEGNRVVAFRGSWTQGADGRVRQRLEEFDLGAQAWIVWFDGFFRRIDGPAK